MVIVLSFGALKEVCPSCVAIFMLDSVQTAKSEYTVALDRIREMRAAEDEAQEETGRSARSVETLAVQVSSATRELDGLQEKVKIFNACLTSRGNT